MDGPYFAVRQLLYRRLRWSAFLLVLLGIGGMTFRYWQNAASLDPLENLGTVPDFALTERSGRHITRSDLQGYMWIMNFIYTACTDTCPLQSAKMARLQNEFKHESGLRFLSITLDPEHDTPPVLRRYAKRFGAAPDRWLFLTGDRASIYRLAEAIFNSGLGDPVTQRISLLQRLIAPAAALADHSGTQAAISHSSLFVLVDQQARIRGYYLSTNEAAVDRLRRGLRSLLT